MSRRGLTLIEVLAALVLMGVITTACLPLLQRARVLLEASPGAVSVYELSAAADTILATPEAFGVDDVAAIVETEVPWPETVTRADESVEAIRITRRSADDAGGGARGDAGGGAGSGGAYAWLIFSSADVSVARWTLIPSEEVEP